MNINAKELQKKYDALLAENEKLKANIRNLNTEVNAKEIGGQFALRRAEKAEAEGKQLRGQLAQALVDNHAVALETEKNLRLKAEAQLALAEPVLKAIREARIYTYYISDERLNQAIRKFRENDNPAPARDEEALK